VKSEAGLSFKACTAALIAGIRKSFHESKAARTVAGKSSSEDGHASKTVCISAVVKAAMVAFSKPPLISKSGD
jgi:hypothetical protein